MFIIMTRVNYDTNVVQSGPTPPNLSSLSHRLPLINMWGRCLNKWGLASTSTAGQQSIVPLCIPIVQNYSSYAYVYFFSHHNVTSNCNFRLAKMGETKTDYLNFWDFIFATY